MKHSAHLIFAMLLLPTVALVAGLVISLVMPEHAAPAAEPTVQAALPSGYLLYGDLEQQP